MDTVLRPAAKPASTQWAIAWGIWRRRLLIGIVVGYMGILILPPVGALLSGVFARGAGPIMPRSASPTCSARSGARS